MASLDDVYAQVAAGNGKPQDHVGNAYADALRGNIQVQPEAPENLSMWDKVKGGLASGPINMYLGAKQLFGPLDPVDQSVLQQNHDAEKRAPVSSFVSNVAALAPAALIPGANTVAGAAAIGGITGALNPVDNANDAASIAKGKAISGTVGTLAGAAGQAIANKVGGYFGQKLADAQANAAADASRNSVRDATLAAGREAGYVVPNSAVSPSFFVNRLESLGGKAAIKQQATAQNQEVTNSLARRALGLPDDAPLSVDAINQVRAANYQPYRDIANLPVTQGQQAQTGLIVGTNGQPLINTPAVKGFDPATALENLKQARFDAKTYFNHYNRTGDPQSLATAKSLTDQAQAIEQQFEQRAAQNGSPQLVKQLQEARKNIAKSYTVERALNVDTGDVNARVLARMSQKGQPLSDGLDTVGKFANAYPQFTGPASTNPAAGVSKSEMLSSALLGATGVASGHPAAIGAALLPFVSHPARALALSKALQRAPDYSVGLSPQVANMLTNSQLGQALLRGSVGAGAALAAQ